MPREARMTGPHNLLDNILLIMITVVWPVAEWRWYYPRSVLAIAAGVPGARARLYRNSIVPQWVFSACIIALWVIRGRPWAALLLGPSTLLRLGIAFGFVALILALLLQQRRALLTRANWPELVRRSLGHADPLVPRTKGEQSRRDSARIDRRNLRGVYVPWIRDLVFPGFLAGHPVRCDLRHRRLAQFCSGFGHIYLGVRNVRGTAIGRGVLRGHRVPRWLASAGDGVAHGP